MAAESELKIPVLTDEVSESAEKVSDTFSDEPADREALIAELQTELAARTYALTDDIMRSAFSEMEARIFAQISGRLRGELPEIIDRLLRERLGDESDY